MNITKIKQMIEDCQKRFSKNINSLQEELDQLKENVNNHIKQINKKSKNNFIKKINSHKILIICPHHEENTPSHMIDLKTNEFYCFGCEMKGTHQVDYVESLRKEME